MLSALLSADHYRNATSLRSEAQVFPFLFRKTKTTVPRLTLKFFFVQSWLELVLISHNRIDCKFPLHLVVLSWNPCPSVFSLSFNIIRLYSCTSGHVFIFMFIEMEWSKATSRIQIVSPLAGNPSMHLAAKQYTLADCLLCVC